MTQEQLDLLQENGAAILVQFNNGLVDARLIGSEHELEIYEHCLRLHYLWGILKNIRLSGGVPYVGDTILTGDDVEAVYHKIWHYNGLYDAVDLSDYSDIDADSGDGTGDTGDEDTKSGTVSEDHYRSGTITSVVGTNVITFSSPLPSSDYTVDVYNTGSTGYQQRNLVTSTKTANGFVCGDVLEAGTLTYFAVIDK